MKSKIYTIFPMQFESLTNVFIFTQTFWTFKKKNSLLRIIKYGFNFVKIHISLGYFSKIKCIKPCIKLASFEFDPPFDP